MIHMKPTLVPSPDPPTIGIETARTHTSAWIWIPSSLRLHLLEPGITTITAFLSPSFLSLAAHRPSSFLLAWLQSLYCFHHHFLASCCIASLPTLACIFAPMQLLCYKKYLARPPRKWFQAYMWFAWMSFALYLSPAWNSAIYFIQRSFIYITRNGNGDIECGDEQEGSNKVVN